MQLDIRPATAADLDTALGWAREEGWNPGLDDAGPFHAADPEGLLLGWLGAEPIGCISVVKYGADYAFLGLYIVRPEYRGRGYGKAIWDAGIVSAGGRSIGLDGVPASRRTTANPASNSPMAALAGAAPSTGRRPAIRRCGR